MSDSIWCEGSACCNFEFPYLEETCVVFVQIHYFLGPTIFLGCHIFLSKNPYSSKNKSFLYILEKKLFFFVAEIGVPMYILQKLGLKSVCVYENVTTKTVQHKDQSLCILETAKTNEAAWHWLGTFNIQ